MANCCLNNDNLYCQLLDYLNVVPGRRGNESTLWLNAPSAFDYETYKYILVKEEIISLIIGIVIISMSRLFIEKFFLNLTRSGYIYVEKGKSKDLDESQKKFSESVYKVIFYTVSMIWAWKISFKYDYIGTLDNMWIYFYSYRTAPADDLWLFNMFELSAYTSMLLFHVFLDVQRNDYWAMFIHHVATISLITIAQAVGGIDATALIIAIHDVNDVLLEMAKTQVYQGREWLANIFFAIFVAAWVYFRLYLFPTTVVYACAKDSIEFVGCYPWHFTQVSLMFTLVILHIYWFLLILKVLIQIITGGGSHDVRESDKENKQD